MLGGFWPENAKIAECFITIFVPKVELIRKLRML